jgi:hypothetical protein
LAPLGASEPDIPNVILAQETRKTGDEPRETFADRSAFNKFNIFQRVMLVSPWASPGGYPPLNFFNHYLAGIPHLMETEKIDSKNRKIAKIEKSPKCNRIKYSLNKTISDLEIATGKFQSHDIDGYTDEISI